MQIASRLRCPVCDYEGETFETYGVRPRPNAKCPRCGCLERHRLLFLYLSRETDVLQSPRDLLDIAPNSALSRRFLQAQGARYVSADLLPGAAMRVADLQALDFPDSSFDVVLCSHVLEHVEDDRKAMREIHRVLRPGGFAVIDVPLLPERTETDEDPALTDPEERKRRFGAADHVRAYGGDGFRDRLREAGFRVECHPYAEELGPDMTHHFALRPSEIIHCCRKA